MRGGGGMGGTVLTPLQMGDGSAAAPSLSFSASTILGLFRPGAGLLGWAWTGSFGAEERIRFDLNSNAATTGILLPSDGALIWGSGTNWASATADVFLKRGGAGVLSLENGTTAQEWRVYGTTTGPKYVAMAHDGVRGSISGPAGNESLRLSPDNFNSYWSLVGSHGGLVSAANYRFAHGVSALATGATEGFFHLQSCAGAPTGAPATIPTGQIPMIMDSTNKKLYAYIGGAWTKGQVAAVDVIWA